MAEQMNLIDINLNVGGATDALKELEALSIGLANRKKELREEMNKLNKSFADGAISEKAYQEATASLNTEVMANNKAISDNNNSIKANISIVQNQANSINDMRAKLALVTKEWSKLSEKELQNTDLGKELSARKRQLTEDLKRLEAATGDTRRNVGNYTDSILKAASSTQMATTGVAGLAGGMAGSINGIKAFNATLAANPIGAIVMAAMLLIQWIEKLASRSSAGGNEMQSAFAPIITIFDRILDAVGKFFTFWFKGIAVVINGAIRLADALGLVSAETKRLADEAARLKKEERDIYNTETERIVQLQRLRTEQEAQKAILADQTKSAEERKKAGEEALRLMKQEEDITVSLAQRKYDLIKSQNALSDSTDEDLRKEAEALAAVEKARTDAAAKRKEIFGQITGFEKQLRDKALAESKAAAQASAKAYEEAQARKKQAAEELYNKQIQRLNDIMAAELLNNRRIIAEGQSNSEIEQAHFEKMQQLKSDLLSKQLEEGKLTLDAYNLATEEMEVERLERIATLNAEARAKEQEVQLANAQAMAELQEANITSEFEIKQYQLDQKLAMEIANAEKIGADTRLIELKYSKMREKIAKEEANAKLAMAGDLAGQLSSLLGEETAAGKAVAITQATINTYLGATKALAQGGFFGIAQAAVVIATGLAQVGKIISIKAEKPEINKPTGRYERGGKMALFGGNRHSEGGTILRGSDGSVLEVERGEAAFVLNRSATSAISALSALNQAHGGNSFSMPGLSFFERGGMMQLSGGGSGLSEKDLERMTSAMVYAISSMPAPIVTVSDITNKSEYAKKITQISVI